MTCSVLIIGLPPAAGCAPSNTWRAAAAFVDHRLDQRFGDRVAFEYAELFSPEMTSHPEIEALVASGAAAPPIVVIDGVRRFSGGKLNLGAIERAVADAIGAASTIGITSTTPTGTDRLHAAPLGFTSATEGRVS